MQGPDDQSYSVMDKTQYSFEQTKVMIPDSYMGDLTLNQSSIPYQDQYMDNSAMGLVAFSDHNMSQIGRDDLDAILQDDEFANKHKGTTKTSNYLRNLFVY